MCASVCVWGGGGVRAGLGQSGGPREIGEKGSWVRLNVNKALARRHRRVEAPKPRT